MLKKLISTYRDFRAEYSVGHTTLAATALTICVVSYAAVTAILDRTDDRVPTIEFAKSFMIGEAGTQLLLDGWSQPERWGTWSEGPKAWLQWQLDDAPLTDIFACIEGRSFSPLGESATQTVRVIVNGEPNATLKFNRETSEVVDGCFRIPRRLALAQNLLKIGFEIAAPTAPSDVGLGTDTRRLGIGLTRIVLRYLPEIIYQK